MRAIVATATAIILVNLCATAEAAPQRVAAKAGRVSAYPQATPELKRQWGVMEEECRGGQHDPEDAICTARNDIQSELERRGVCWAYSDWRVTNAEYSWHPCAQARPRGWSPR